MNNFIFENKTKVYFGKGGVKEYLGCLLKQYGPTVMLAYGGGSIKKNGVYDEVAVRCPIAARSSPRRRSWTRTSGTWKWSSTPSPASSFRWAPS